MSTGNLKNQTKQQTQQNSPKETEEQRNERLKVQAQIRDLIKKEREFTQDVLHPYLMKTDLTVMNAGETLLLFSQGITQLADHYLGKKKVREIITFQDLEKSLASYMHFNSIKELYYLVKELKFGEVYPYLSHYSKTMSEWTTKPVMTTKVKDLDIKLNDKTNEIFFEKRNGQTPVQDSK